MKRLLTILLIISCLYQSIGFYVIAKIQVAQIKQHSNLRASVANAKKLSLIPINTSGTQNKAHSIRFINNKEFLYQGHMYDIVAKISIYGSNYYMAYKDIKETRLNTLLKNLSKETAQRSSNKETSQNLIKLLISNWFNESLHPYTVFNTRCQTIHVAYKANLNKGFATKTIPPPKHSF